MVILFVHAVFWNAVKFWENESSELVQAVEEFRRCCSAVPTQHLSVTDGQTDIQNCCNDTANCIALHAHVQYWVTRRRVHSFFTYYMKYRDCQDITAVFWRWSSWSNCCFVRLLLSSVWHTLCNTSCLLADLLQKHRNDPWNWRGRQSPCSQSGCPQCFLEVEHNVPGDCEHVSWLLTLASALNAYTRHVRWWCNYDTLSALH